MFTYPVQRLTLLAYLRETFRLYGCGFPRFFLLFLGLAIVSYGISTFLVDPESVPIAVKAKTALSTDSPPHLAKQVTRVLSVTWVWNLVLTFFSYCLGVIALYAVHSTEGSGKINFDFSQLRQRFLVLCGLFCALLAFVVPFLATFMVLALFWNPHLAILVFLPIILFLVVRLSPILPEVIWGNGGLISAFRRVWALTRGHFFFILVRGFTVALISYLGLGLVHYLWTLVPSMHGAERAINPFLSLLVTFLWTVPLDAAAHLLVWRQLHIDQA
tara:strand:+ start:633 stop:1451 length:819 start_codon:yes stop_codon:yes gene_type:complete